MVMLKITINIMKNATIARLWKPLKPGIERKTLCIACVQSLADTELGLPAKMVALLQKRRPSYLACLGRHVCKPLF